MDEWVVLDSTMEYYTENKMNEQLLHTTLTKGSQTKEHTEYCFIHIKCKNKSN